MLALNQPKLAIKLNRGLPLQLRGLPPAQRARNSAFALIEQKPKLIVILSLSWARDPVLEYSYVIVEVVAQAPR